jgi:hypothetical protein
MWTVSLVREQFLSGRVTGKAEVTRPHTRQALETDPPSSPSTGNVLGLG